ncbi:MAG: hypothetical protein HY917_03195 [Candidatus Diapherotrites archaeon]|nr:hypothetical protein [Candidatus Diapherotrites archaeon]
MNLFSLTQQLAEQLSSARDRAHARNWKEFAPSSFLIHLAQTIQELQSVHATLQQIQEQFRKEERTSPFNPTEEKEFTQLLERLKRNHELELRKTRSGPNASEQQQELYASLEHQTQHLLLKLQYLNERLTLAAKRIEAPPISHEHGNLRELLELKENELQKLQEKFARLARESPIHSLTQKPAADLEHETQGIAQALESELNSLRETLRTHQHQLHTFNAHYSNLAQKITHTEQFAHQFILQHQELTRTLKNEKDHAQKLALSMEHETLSLRHAYTHKTLSLEESIDRARSQGTQAFAEENEKLRSELREKTKTLQRLETILDDREKEIQKLKQRKK